MEQQAYPGLEIDIDPQQQRREWVLQRIAWVFFAALLIGVILGLLGEGWLSTRKIASPDGSLRLEYERFMRHHSPDSLYLHMPAPAETVRVSLASDYLKQIQIEKIMPQPAQVISETGAVSFIFHANSRTGMAVAFHISPDKIGTLEGWVAVDGNPPLSFRQFVYP